MKIKHLTAISPIDGRYEAQTKELRSFFSEFGLMKYRVQVEIEWFIHLSNQRTIPQLPRLSNNMKQNISNLYKKFSYKDNTNEASSICKCIVSSFFKDSANYALKPIDFSDP